MSSATLYASNHSLETPPGEPGFASTQQNMTFLQIGEIASAHFLKHTCDLSSYLFIATMHNNSFGKIREQLILLELVFDDRNFLLMFIFELFSQVRITRGYSDRSE